MGKSWSANLAPVWPLASITDKINSHLSLGRLNGRVGLSWWHGITLREEQEVVDQSFHVLLHGSSGWWRDLVVFHSNWSRWHLVEALVDDTEGLSEFLHAAEISVVAVSVDTDWNIKLDLVVRVIWLALANIPWHTGSTKHNTGERQVQSIGSRHNSNALCAANPDSVISQKLLRLINTIGELRCPLIDVVE